MSLIREIVSGEMMEQDKIDMDAPQKQPEPPTEDKRNAFQKNYAAAGCLSVIVLVTAVCMICLISNVPLNYYWGSNEDKRYFKDGKIVKTWQDDEK